MLAHGAVEVHDLVLVVLQHPLDLDNLQIDLVREHLGIAAKTLELRLSRRHHRLQADLERLRVQLDLRGVGVEVGPELLVRILRHLRAEVGGVSDAIIVLHVLLLQGVNTSGMIGKRLCDITMMSFLLLPDAADNVCEVLEARQRSQRSVVTVAESLGPTGLVSLWPLSCSRCSRVMTGSSSRLGSNARRRPRNTRL